MKRDRVEMERNSLMLKMLTMTKTKRIQPMFQSGALFMSMT